MLEKFEEKLMDTVDHLHKIVVSEMSPALRIEAAKLIVGIAGMFGIHEREAETDTENDPGHTHTIKSQPEGFAFTPDPTLAVDDPAETK